MKSNRLMILFSLIFIGLAGCSSVPTPMKHEYKSQTTLEASDHWGILAQDFASKIVATMMTDPLFILDNRGSGNSNILDSNGSGNVNDMYVLPPVTKGAAYVELPSIYLQTTDLSDFGKTFRSYLITEITKLGYPVANTPDDAVIATWSVNKVRHNANRASSGWPATWTTAALVGSGVYEIIDNSSSAFAGVLLAGIALDTVNAAGEYILPNDVPHTEIVLTFTVSKDAKVLSRQTQAYYVNEEDFNHYNNIADYAGQNSHLTPVKFSVTH